MNSSSVWPNHAPTVEKPISLASKLRKRTNAPAKSVNKPNDKTRSITSYFPPLRTVPARASTSIHSSNRQNWSRSMTLDTVKQVTQKEKTFDNGHVIRTKTIDIVTIARKQSHLKKSYFQNSHRSQTHFNQFRAPDKKQLSHNSLGDGGFSVGDPALERDIFSIYDFNSANQLPEVVRTSTDTGLPNNSLSLSSNRDSRYKTADRRNMSVNDERSAAGSSSGMASLVSDISRRCKKLQRSRSIEHSTSPHSTQVKISEKIRALDAQKKMAGFTSVKHVLGDVMQSAKSTSSIAYKPIMEHREAAATMPSASSAQRDIQRMPRARVSATSNVSQSLNRSISLDQLPNDTITLDGASSRSEKKRSTDKIECDQFDDKGDEFLKHVNVSDKLIQPTAEHLDFFASGIDDYEEILPEQDAPQCGRSRAILAQYSSAPSLAYNENRTVIMSKVGSCIGASMNRDTDQRASSLDRSVETAVPFDDAHSRDMEIAPNQSFDNFFSINPHKGNRKKRMYNIGEMMIRASQPRHQEYHPDLDNWRQVRIHSNERIQPSSRFVQATVRRNTEEKAAEQRNRWMQHCEGRLNNPFDTSYNLEQYREDHVRYVVMKMEPSIDPKLNCG